MTINALRILHATDQIALLKESETGSFTGALSGFVNSYSDIVDVGSLDTSFIFTSLSGGAAYSGLTSGVSAQGNNMAPTHAAFENGWVTLTAASGYHFTLNNFNVRFVRFTKGTGNDIGADTRIIVFNTMCNFYTS
jgi:hypothetical protein